MIETTIPDGMREARLRAGLTQAELARRAGVDRANLAAVERGARGASLRMLRRIAAAMGARIEVRIW